MTEARVRELVEGGRVTEAEGAELIAALAAHAQLQRLVTWIDVAGVLTIAGWIAFLFLALGGS